MYLPQCAALVERTADSPELWIGANDGFVYWIQNTAATSWANTASTEAVNAQFETQAVPLGAGPGSRGEPRYVQIEASTSAQSVWTMTVTVLSDAEGATIGTVSRTVTLPAGNSSPIVPVPKMGVRGSWAKIKLTNATTGGNGVIKKIRLYYVPRGDFRGPRSA